MTTKKKGFEERAQSLQTLRPQFQVAPEIRPAVEAGEAAFLDLVAARLLEASGVKGLVKRCPECRKIVRTPRARLCLWCGHDWH